MAKTDVAVESGGGDRKERGGVQSLERAFSILEEVARHREGIGLADLAKRMGLHNSTTFHLVKTMVSLGYVRQSKETKRYRVGPRLFSLAAGSLDEVELVALATPVLEDLARASGEASHLAVRSGDDVVIAAKVQGTGAFQLVDRAGVVRPAHCTALGKVLLAALPPAELDRWFAERTLEPFTPKSITEPDRLRAELARVRESGVGFDDGEFDAEVRCIAVAIHDFTGRVAGAIGISGPVWRVSMQTLQEQTHRVQQAARRLSAELGAGAASAAG